MDKSKAINVLRGMKFMQRKEEAKRRALYEIEQQNQIEQHLRELDAANEADLPSSAPSATLPPPIIIRNSPFPRSGYLMACRTFDFNPNEVVTPPVEEFHPRETPIARSPPRARSESRGATEDLWEEDEEGKKEEEVDPSAPLWAPTPVATSNAAPVQPARTETKREGGGRFHPPNAINAPKLPKRLAKEMMARQGGSKRRRKDADDGAPVEES
ncbi:unnamed protein product [Phytomonas sp. EM1]|nr:unnamed protein product [Phytomonas sp. EM1]|eukprot:CCW62489.1 unnamed protein product [Phytomonas sp. isolate EM1]